MRGLIFLLAWLPTVVVVVMVCYAPRMEDWRVELWIRREERKRGMR